MEHSTVWLKVLAVIVVLGLGGLMLMLKFGMYDRGRKFTAKSIVSEPEPQKPDIEELIERDMHGLDSLPCFLDGMLAYARRSDRQNFNFYRAQLQTSIEIIEYEYGSSEIPSGVRADFFNVLRKIAGIDDMSSFLAAADTELREYAAKHKEFYLGLMSVFPHFPGNQEGESL